MAKRNTPQSFSADFVEGLLKTIHEESDRGCVLCLVGVIDEALESAVRSFFRKASDAADGLLDKLLTSPPLPPLGSFAVRTIAARALGLIDETHLKALNEIRDMRNAAAHVPVSFSLNRYALTDLWSVLHHEDRRVIEQAAQEFPQHRSRDRFEFAATVVYWRLLKIADAPENAKEIIKWGMVDTAKEWLQSKTQNAPGHPNPWSLWHG